MSSLLESVSGERSVHPASRHVNLGLDHHTPVSALRTFLTDENALSDALHELTHFHSLANPIGAVFSAWSYLYKLAADDLALRVREAQEGIDLSLARCLALGMRMEEAEEVWRPLLEGLAVYAQTSAPCTYLDTMIAPLQTLRWFEISVESLDPASHSSSIAPPSSTIIEAGERCAARGASLSAGDGMRLGEWVELSTEPRAFPYFVGHAFVRSLQTHLRSVSDDFDCPQNFLDVMFRIMRGSWAHLIGRHGELIRYPNEAAPRVYGLTLDIFADSRPDEVSRLLEPDFNVDILRWLELGHAIPPLPWDTQTLSSTMKEWFASEWKLVPEDEQKFSMEVLTSAIIQTHVLSITSGGTCEILGIVPRAEGYAHAFALNVSGATWWLMLDDDASKSLGISPSDLVRLPIEAMRVGSHAEGKVSLTLQMSSFLCLRETKDADHRARWSLDVLLTAPSGATLTVSAGPGPPGLGRAVLRAGAEVLKTRDVLRELLETPLDCAKLSFWLEKQGFGELANSTRENWSTHCLRLEKRRHEINETILKTLLSPGAHVEDAAEALARERMGFVLSNLKRVRDMLVASYAAPVQLTGPGAADTAEMLHMMNQTSKNKLGRAVFDLKRRQDLGTFIRYLGIWERSSRPVEG